MLRRWLLLLLRMHRWLLLLIRALLLLLIHHMLLLLLLLLHVLMLLKRWLLSLHVGVLGVHLMMHLGLDEGVRAVGSVEDAALVIDRGRLELAARVDDRRRGMAIRGWRVTHVTAHRRARRR